MEPMERKKYISRLYFIKKKKTKLTLKLRWRKKLPTSQNSQKKGEGSLPH